MRGQTVKYNTKIRAGRGFTLAELRVSRAGDACHVMCVDDGVLVHVHVMHDVVSVVSCRA